MRRLLRGIDGVVIAALLAVRVYHEAVPWGAGALPYLMAGVPGAAHSGSHWTWIIRRSWLIGPEVVAHGYCDPGAAIDGSPLPAVWLNPTDVEITFLSSRYGGRAEVVRVSLGPSSFLSARRLLFCAGLLWVGVRLTVRREARKSVRRSTSA